MELLTTLSVSFLILNSLFIFKSRLPKELKYSLGAFSVLWSFAVSLAYISFNGRFSINETAFILAALNVFSFSLGVFINKRKKSFNNNFSWDGLIDKVDKLSRKRMFVIIMIILCFYLFSLLVKYYDALAFSTAADIRTDFFDSEKQFYGPYFRLLNSWILKPVNFFALSILPVTLYKRNFLPFFLLLIYVLIYNTLGGGRFGYVQIAWSFYFILFVVLKKIVFSINFKTVLISFVGILLLYYLIATTTAARMGISTNLFGPERKELIKITNDQISLYISGPIAALGYSIDHDYMGKMNGCQYGQLTFGSADYAISIVANKITTYKRSLPEFAEIKQENKIQISDTTISWNALYTAIIFFYLDFGLFGVILFPIFFGYLFVEVLSCLRRTHSILGLVLSNFIFLQMMHSIFDFVIYDWTDFVILFVSFIVLFISSKKV